MTRDEELRRDLQEEFPHAWWIFYFNLDEALTKVAVLIGSLSMGAGVYLVLGDRAYFAIPFFGAAAACGTAASMLHKAQKLVGEIYDKR